MTGPTKTQKGVSIGFRGYLKRNINKLEGHYPSDTQTGIIQNRCSGFIFISCFSEFFNLFVKSLPEFVISATRLSQKNLGPVVFRPPITRSLALSFYLLFAWDFAHLPISLLEV
jgi:hypothetical protein